jgi:hypothetical protein
MNAPAAWNEEILGIKIEANGDGTLTLEQEWSGNVERVTVHPVHLRYMIDRMGLLPLPSATTARLVRDVEKLKRRLLVLKPRIDHLGEVLSYSGNDLEHEQQYASATVDICDEFCADIDDLGWPSEVVDALQGAGMSPETPRGQAVDTRGTNPITNPLATQRVLPQ